MDGTTPDVISTGAPWTLRAADAADLPALRDFGHTHVRAHYEPLLGAEAAERHSATWWSEEQLRPAVADGLVVIAVQTGTVIGVAEHGAWGADPVLWKLYVHPDHRDRGLGRVLLDDVLRRLPVDAERLWLEHFATNDRAAMFYERHGFLVERIDRSDAGPAHDVVWRTRRL